ncbi:hypothetical protein LUX57_50720 [Actinomadura madurae]|nr:hypothetical protein [Actinomadura madurae]MCP9972349.1 hypothetical protein [Actinomadura madurae]
MSATAAAQPIVAAVGSRPMRKVAPPITTVEATSIGLRPYRSPKWPATAPPTGRATNPTAKVENEASVEAVSPSPEKNSGPRKMADAVA